MAKRKQWNPKAMVEAVRKKEMGYKTAAKTFLVPRATLKDDAKSSLEPQDMVNRNLGRPTVLPKVIGANACRILSPDNRKNFYALTVGDLPRKAFQLAKKNNLPHLFSCNKSKTGLKMSTAISRTKDMPVFS
uniref:Uncharacterized protein n=1 Tax=Rhodnius prolixus TaxID=13249 RepID=T1HJK4_RHOPR